MLLRFRQQCEMSVMADTPRGVGTAHIPLVGAAVYSDTKLDVSLLSADMAELTSIQLNNFSL